MPEGFGLVGAVHSTWWVRLVFASAIRRDWLSRLPASTHPIRRGFPSPCRVHVIAEYVRLSQQIGLWKYCTSNAVASVCGSVRLRAVLVRTDYGIA